MGKIIVSEYVTLDGVVEDNGGAAGFERGGWRFQCDPGEEGEAFKLQEMRDAAALLLGRVTYDAFARWWPSQEGELADLLNALPKYVVSSTIENPGWNTHVLTGNPVEQIAQLTRELHGDIVVHGSMQLAQTLIDNNLVDELRLMVFPVVLGDGKRLFGPTRESKRFQLTASRQVGADGVLVVTYQPATDGEPSDQTARPSRRPARPDMHDAAFIKKLALPPGFVAPTRLTYEHLIATAITRADLHDDVRGINAGLALIRRTRGGNWPTEPVTEEINFVDLVWHELEFREGASLTYVVRDADGGYLGCCYLYPMGRRTTLSEALLGYDVDVSWWVTPDAYARGAYQTLYRALHHWLREQFPFHAPYYSNTEIPHA